jgi:hypothetical protein
LLDGAAGFAGETEMTKNIVARNKRKRHVILGTVIKVNGRTVGQVIDGVFVKDVSSSKHFLHSPEAIAYTIDTLHAAQRAGAEFVEVLDTDTGIRYRASIAKIWDMGKKFNYGWGDQIYLTLQNWLQTVDPEYTAHTDTMPLTYKSHAITGTHFTKTGKKTPKQLRMFGNGGHYG